MITIQDVREHLSIDWEDEVIDRRLASLISTAVQFMQGALGSNYPDDDHRVREMMLITIEDLYDRRADNAKLSTNVQRLFENFALQIRLEAREW